nr:aldose reductase-related protein 1-like [Ciona intestinalis]|eukprot:XP_002132077.1 aldose reductase-related protein 1-like [Ciona intestinalis]
MPYTESLTLNTGAKMPLLGFGTWQTPKEEIKKCVELAIDEGYRHIDGAWVYQNEEGIGEAVEAKIKEGIIKREDIFITSKLWSTFHEADDVRESLLETLSLLKTDYVDLYLMHWPWSMKKVGKEILPKDENGKFLYTDVDYVDAWKAMESVCKEGLAKNIGVSNFNEFQVSRLLKECTVVPAVNQMEVHPYLADTKRIEFFQSKGIRVTAYSPLGSAQRPWGKPEEPVVLNDPTLNSVAKRLGKTAAQVALRFQIQRDVIVIPKSVKPHRIRENAQIFDFKLSDDDMKLIAGVDKNWRACGMDITNDAKYWPFRPNYTE